MTDLKSWDLPSKVQGGWMVRLTFKKFEDAIEFMVKNGIIGANSAEQTVEVWKNHNVAIINKEAKGMRTRLRKWFKL